MALTKASKFNTKENQLADWSRALGHPARIAIVQLLSRRNTCFCGDITEELPLAQSTVSQHLKVLKKAGIITGEVDGVRSCYCLNEDTIREMNTHFSKFFEQLSTGSARDCC